MIDVAVVGLGAVASMLHLPALRRMQDVRLVGGCDTDAARRREWSRRSGSPTFEDAEQLLEQTRPHVVIVGTPPESHAQVVEVALTHGVHVVCEKPLARSVAEADRMIALAERAGLKLAVNQPFRTMPIFAALSRELGSLRTGELVFLSAWQLMDLPPWEERGWRAELVQGTLYESGIHLVDLALWLYGTPPVAVFARADTGSAAPREGADAVLVLTIEFAGGRLAQLTFNRLSRGPVRYAEVRADAERASLRASYGGRAAVRAGLLGHVRPTVRWEYGPSGLAWLEQGNRRRTLASNPRDTPSLATATLFGAIFDAFRAGKEPPCSAREGRTVLDVIAAAYASAESGLRLELDDASAPWRTRDMAAAVDAAAA